MLDAATLQKIFNNQLTIEPIPGFEEDLIDGLSLFLKYPSMFQAQGNVSPTYHTESLMLGECKNGEFIIYHDYIKPVLAHEKQFKEYGDTLNEWVVSNAMPPLYKTTHLSSYIRGLAYAHLSVFCLLLGNEEKKRRLLNHADTWHFLITFAAMFQGVPDFVLRTLSQPFFEESRHTLIAVLNTKTISDADISRVCQLLSSNESLMRYLGGAKLDQPEYLIQYLLRRFSGDALLEWLAVQNDTLPFKIDFLKCMTESQQASLSPIGLYQALKQTKGSHEALRIVKADKKQTLEQWQRDDLKSYYAFIKCVYSEIEAKVHHLLEADNVSGRSLTFSAGMRVKHWIEANVDRIVMAVGMASTGIDRELLRCLEVYYNQYVSVFESKPRTALSSHRHMIEGMVAEPATLEDCYSAGIRLASLKDQNGQWIVTRKDVQFNSSLVLNSILRERSLQAQSLDVLQVPLGLQRVICGALLGLRGFNDEERSSEGWSTTKEAWIHWMINTHYSNATSYQRDFLSMQKFNDAMLFDEACALFLTDLKVSDEAKTINHFLGRGGSEQHALTRRSLRLAMLSMLLRHPDCMQAMSHRLWMGESSLLQNILMSHKSSNDLQATPEWELLLHYIRQVKIKPTAYSNLYTKAFSGQGSVRHAILYFSLGKYDQDDIGLIQEQLAKVSSQAVSEALMLFSDEDFVSLKLKFYSLIAEEGSWREWARPLIQRAEEDATAPLPAFVELLKTRTRHRTLKETGTYVMTKQSLFAQSHGVVALGEADKQNKQPSSLSSSRSHSSRQSSSS